MKKVLPYNSEETQYIEKRGKGGENWPNFCQ
jgi:hypothetical protein